MGAYGEDVLRVLADGLEGIRLPHPARVAVDGIDGAGKTTLADELAAVLRRPVIRASADGFHRPKAERYRRGAESAAGYYLDAFDYPALRRELLEPLGPGGSRRYRVAMFDLDADEPAPAPQRTAPEEALLLVDGVFLLRPELDDAWDFRIFVDTPFPVALERAIARDAQRLGSPAAVRQRYRRRYFPAQRRYLQAVRPQAKADVVV